MNPDLLGIIVAAILATIAGLVIQLKKLKDKSSKLQREKDVRDIKTQAYGDIDKERLDSLVNKLNRKIADDKTSH